MTRQTNRRTFCLDNYETEHVLWSPARWSGNRIQATESNSQVKSDIWGTLTGATTALRAPCAMAALVIKLDSARRQPHPETKRQKV